MNTEPLTFHPVTIEDRPIMDGHATICGGMNCDINFMNIYSYQFRYHTEVALWRRHLVFRFLADGHVAYMALIDPADVPALLDVLLSESDRGGYPFLLMGLCENMIPLIEQARPGYFVFTYDRDYCDYIYSRETLEKLAGKKLQPRRNFVNRFRKKYPDYEYRALTPDDFPACLEIDKRWIQRKSNGEVDEEDNAERQSIKRVFSQWDKLNGRGGVIYLKGDLVAFTFGAEISPEIFDVCVEKASPLYEGSYAIINQEFVSHLPQQYLHINREEDLGIEGLRKVKLSYRPEILLKKYSVMAKHHFQDGKIK